MSSKRQFWFQHIEAWRKSQMTQTEYARQHNLSIKSFGYYRRRYFREQQAQTEATRPTLLPVSVVTDEAVKPGEPSAPGITLTSPGGCRIELATGFDPVALGDGANLRFCSCLLRKVRISPVCALQKAALILNPPGRPERHRTYSHPP